MLEYLEWSATTNDLIEWPTTTIHISQFLILSQNCGFLLLAKTQAKTDGEWKLNLKSECTSLPFFSCFRWLNMIYKCKGINRSNYIKRKIEDHMFLSMTGYNNYKDANKMNKFLVSLHSSLLSPLSPSGIVRTWKLKILKMQTKTKLP